MGKNLFLLLSIATSVCTANAQKEDGAVYITTAAKDTVAINLTNNPSIRLGSPKAWVLAKNSFIKSLPITDGLKIAFGKELLMGDANRDEKVDLDDAKIIVDDFIGKETNIDRNAADVNLNGSVDIDDANTIVNQTVK